MTPERSAKRMERAAAKLVKEAERQGIPRIDIGQAFMAAGWAITQQALGTEAANQAMEALRDGE